MSPSKNGKGPRRREPLPIDRTRAECSDRGAEALASEYLEEFAARFGVGGDYCREVALAAEAAVALARRPIARLLWKRDYIKRAHAMRCDRLLGSRGDGPGAAAAVAAQ